MFDGLVEHFGENFFSFESSGSREKNVSMRERPEVVREVERVVILCFSREATLHSRPQRIENRRAMLGEISGELARCRPRLDEDETEKRGLMHCEQSILTEYPTNGRARFGGLNILEARREIRERPVRYMLKQLGLAGEMMVQGSRADAERRGDVSHRNITSHPVLLEGGLNGRLP